jgi:hypothetical protein
MYDGSNWMEGIVTSTGSTGTIVTIDYIVGSGTYATWTLLIEGKQGLQGNQGYQGTGGAQGYQGFQGSSGGPQGYQGYQGPQGSSTGITPTSGVSTQVGVFTGATTMTSYNWLKVDVGNKRIGMRHDGNNPGAHLDLSDNNYSDGGASGTGQIWFHYNGTGSNYQSTTVYFNGGDAFDERWTGPGAGTPNEWRWRNRNAAGWMTWENAGRNPSLQLNRYGKFAINKQLSNTDVTANAWFTLHVDNTNEQAFRLESQWGDPEFLQQNGAVKIGANLTPYLTYDAQLFISCNRDSNEAITVYGRWGGPTVFTVHEGGTVQANNFVAVSNNTTIADYSGVHILYSQDTGAGTGYIHVGKRQAPTHDRLEINTASIDINTYAGTLSTTGYFRVHAADDILLETLSSGTSQMLLRSHGNMYFNTTDYSGTGFMRWDNNGEHHGVNGSVYWQDTSTGSPFTIDYKGLFAVNASNFHINGDANGHVAIGLIENFAFALTVPNYDWIGAVNAAHNNVEAIVCIDDNDLIRFAKNHAQFQDFYVDFEGPNVNDVLTWTGSAWMHQAPGSGGITGSGTTGRAMRWNGTNAANDSSLVLPTGASILTLSPSATCTLTVAGTASVIGTFSASGRTLTVQTGDMKLTGAGSTSELALANAKFAFAGGGTSCSITFPNFAMTFAGAAGKTLTLTNSLTNQGGNDGILSWSGAYTLTIPATGTAALLGTANVFTALQTASISDAATNTITNSFNVTHNSSSGSVAATFGARIYFNLKSTTTADTNAASIETQWVVATHASRTARTTFTTIDYGAAREVIRIEGSGTAALLSFFGVTAVVRPTAYTQTYNTASKTAAALTYASPGAYAGGTNGYSTTTQAQAVITALGQLNADTIAIYKVLTQVIDDLQALGLLQ